jgi:hypothetical protein
MLTYDGWRGKPGRKGSPGQLTRKRISYLRITITKDWTEERILEELANEINPVVFPFQVAEAYREFLEPREVSKLADQAITLGAKIAVIGCYEDPKSQISQKKAELEKRLGDFQCQVWTIVPPPDVFEPTPYS